MPQIELKLLIGGYAQKWHLGKRAEASVTETVMNWRNYYEEPQDGVRTLPLPHPSWRNTGWLKNNPWFAEELLPVLRQEIRRLVK
jgi:uracil-DNA glycosylase